MNAAVRAACLVAITALAQSASLKAQADYRGVYAGVVDRAGAPVPGLTAADFIVREDGVAREVLRVSVANTPMQIAVLIDNSQALRADLYDLRQALAVLVKDLQGKHEVALIGFGGRPAVLVDYTRETPKLEAALARLAPRPESGSYLLQAIIETSRGFRRRSARRPVIVVITGEGQEFSEISYQVPLDYLRENGVTLHSYVIGKSGPSPRDEAAQEVELILAQGTRLSGGRREDLLSSMGLTIRLQALAAELNGQYQVVYARPAALIPPKTLEVSVKSRDWTVRSRRWISE